MLFTTNANTFDEQETDSLNISLTHSPSSLSVLLPFNYWTFLFSTNHFLLTLSCHNYSPNYSPNSASILFHMLLCQHGMHCQMTSVPHHIKLKTQYFKSNVCYLLSYSMHVHSYCSRQRQGKAKSPMASRSSPPISNGLEPTENIHSSLAARSTQWRGW